MADNVTLPASAQVIATDEIAGVHYPRTKITLGADGTDDGDVSGANPLPVTVAGGVQDATVLALNDLNDTMLYMLGAILEKMPRVTGNDQMAISIETGSVGITGNQTLGNMTNLGGRYATNAADGMAMAGTSHIYSNITVS